MAAPPDGGGGKALNIEELFADALSNDQTIPARPPDQNLASLKLLSAMNSDQENAKTSNKLFSSLARAESVWLTVAGNWLSNDKDLRNRLGGFSWTNTQRVAAFLRREYDLYALRNKASTLFQNNKETLAAIAGSAEPGTMVAGDGGGLVMLGTSQAIPDGIVAENDYLKALWTQAGNKVPVKGDDGAIL